MPEFTRTAYYGDYETETYVNVSLDIEFENEFEVTVEDFFDNMHDRDKDDMLKLLMDNGFVPSVGQFLDAHDSGTLSYLNDAISEHLVTVEDDDGALRTLYWPTTEQFVRDLSRSAGETLYNTLLAEGRLSPPALPEPSEYWRKATQAQRQKLAEIIKESNIGVHEDQSALYFLANRLIASSDNEFFGLPDELLAQLRQRLDTRTLPSVPVSASADPSLLAILAALEPGTPLDASLLTEMRLLAGSTSNAS
jgi:hypothetical protein